jgi:ribonuclease P protein subunit POP4
MPKEHTIFRFEIPLDNKSESTNGHVAEQDSKSEKVGPKSIILELHGSSFEHRAPDRATRKFVMHPPDL